jgi:hypothetical protein
MNVELLAFNRKLEIVQVDERPITMLGILPATAVRAVPGSEFFTNNGVPDERVVRQI